MKKNWYKFKDQADPAVAELHIDDFIGDWDAAYFGTTDVTAKALVQALSDLPESVQTIRVHINSPGGDVSAAVNIANALRAQAAKGRTVEAIVDGIAASSASLIAMAGAPVVMADNAIMMVHNPWTIAVGNADEMRKSADVLDTFRDTIVSTYQWHSKLDSKAIEKLMDAETWMTAAEALENGFADEVLSGLKAVASISPRGAKLLKVPEKFRAQVEALLVKDEEPSAADPEKAPESEEESVPVPVDGEPVPVVEEEPAAEVPAEASDVLDLVAAAALPVSFAQGLFRAKASRKSAEAAIAAEKDKAAKETARCAAIRAACALAKQADMADDLIASGATVEAAKALVQKVLAKLDGATEIVTALGPDDMAKGSKKAGAELNLTKVYAERNGLRLVKE